MTIIPSKVKLTLRFCQEPITRSVQLLLTLSTAFLQVGLFLDTPFPRKFVADDVRIKEEQEPIAPDGS